MAVDITSTIEYFVNHRHHKENHRFAELAASEELCWIETVVY